MKIRTDFVTNSSSSSFVALTIESPLLSDILSSFSKTLSEREPGACDDFPLQPDEDGNVDFSGYSDLDEFILTDVPPSIDRLVQYLCTGIAELSEWNGISHNSAVALVRVLKGHEQEITESVRKARWVCTSQCEGEYYDPLIVDQRTIDTVRQEIANEEHRPLETVTEDDYLERIDRMGICVEEKHEFNYDRKQGVEDYQSGYYLKR